MAPTEGRVANPERPPR